MSDFLYLPYLSVSHSLFLTFKFLFVDILLFISEGLDKICVREDTEDHTPSSLPTRVEVHGHLGSSGDVGGVSGVGRVIGRGSSLRSSADMVRV